MIVPTLIVAVAHPEVAMTVLPPEGTRGADRLTVKTVEGESIPPEDRLLDAENHHPVAETTQGRDLPMTAVKTPADLDRELPLACIEARTRFRDR